ncbi:MAG: hypothetical protein ACR2PQ_09335 [Myxococcota bacterium]
MDGRKRWVVRLLGLLVVVEVVWLVGANLLLNSAFAEQLINRKPEKLTVRWESARTWYPARVHVRGLAYWQKTRTLEIDVHASEAAASFRFLPALTGRVVLDGVDAHDLAVSIDRHEPQGPEPPKREPGVQLAFTDIEVHGFERFSFGDIAVAGGEPALTGSFALQIRGPISLTDAELDWKGAQITTGEEIIAESISLGFAGDVAPFHPKLDKGRKLLQKISGVIDIDGHSSDLRPLRLLLPDVAWIERLSGAGNVALHAILDEGKLAPGTDIDVAATGLELWFLGFAAEGTGRVAAEVFENGDESRGDVEVVFDEFAFSRQGQQAPLGRGSGLKLTAGLTARGSEVDAEDIDIVLDIPDAEAPDVGFLASQLPPSLGIELLGGGATLSGHLEVHDAEAKGEFRIDGESLEGTFRDMEFAMDLAFVTQISGRDLEAYEVELAGTEVRLFNGAFDGAETEVEDGWWMTIAVPEGASRLAEPVTIDADLELSMRDTRAILAAFAEVKRWIRHFDGILTVKDVAGSAGLAVDGSRVTVRDLSLTGDRLEVLAQLELFEEEDQGIFWGKLGILSLGLERTGTENDFKFTNSRKWYEEKYAAEWMSEPAVAAPGPAP